MYGFPYLFTLENRYFCGFGHAFSLARRNPMLRQGIDWVIFQPIPLRHRSFVETDLSLR